MNEVSKNLMCIIMRNGVEIWKEEDRLWKLEDRLLQQDSHNFIKIDDILINSADITGIFNAKTMEEFRRRKNGEWQCKKGKWHEKGGQCDCARTIAPEFVPPTISDEKREKGRKAIEKIKKINYFKEM